MTDNRFNGICPICGRSYRGRPATSRTDNSTPICPDTSYWAHPDIAEAANEHMAVTNADGETWVK